MIHARLYWSCHASQYHSFDSIKTRFNHYEYQTSIRMSSAYIQHTSNLRSVSPKVTFKSRLSFQKQLSYFRTHNVVFIPSSFLLILAHHIHKCTQGHNIYPKGVEACQLNRVNTQDLCVRSQYTIQWELISPYPWRQYFDLQKSMQNKFIAHLICSWLPACLQMNK